MEVIKKTVQRKMRLISSGNSLGYITPDLRAVYYFNLNINAEVRDWGFFDAYVVEEEENQFDTEFDYVVELPDDDVIVIPPEKVLVPIETAPISVTTGNWTVSYSNPTLPETITPIERESLPTDDGLSSFDTLTDAAV